MSRLGTKTYSRKQECKTSLNFDQLLSEKCNKPSTAKVSMTSVHRWGMTSFTSLRKSQLNGRSESSLEDKNIFKKPRVELMGSSGKSDLNSFTKETDFSPSVFIPDDAVGTVSSSLSVADSNITEERKNIAKPKKFFKSSDRILKTYGSLPLSRTNEILTSKQQSNSESGALKLDSLSLHTATAKIVSVQKVGDNTNFLNEDDNKCVSSEITKNTELDLIKNTSHHSASINVCNDLPKHKDFDRLMDEEFIIKRKMDGIDRSILPCTPDQGNDIPVPDFDSQDHQTFSSSDNFINYKSEQVPHVVQTYFKRKAKQGVELTQLQPVCGDIHSSNCEDDTSQGSQRLKTDTTSLLRCNLSEEEYHTDELTEARDLKKENSVDTNMLFESFRQDISKESMQSKLSQPPLRTKKIFSSPKKHKAVYNLRHWQSSQEAQEMTEDDTFKKPSVAEEFENEELLETTSQTVLTRHVQQSTRPWYDPVTSVKCPRKVKELYTVVRNVKQAHQCHEFGETQEFNDDIEYLLEGVQSCNGIGTRCLSVLSLATKCMVPSFRIHVRAHGTAPKIFSALMDAPSDPNLALCTATLLFILSQDRLTMDLDAGSLSLMLQLLETDPEEIDPEMLSQSSSEDGDVLIGRVQVSKNREKVRQLCEQMKQKGHARHLNLDKINTGNLAMETLLSLTSRKAGEWFKEEMRSLGGLDHLVDTVKACVGYFSPEDPMEDPEDIQLDRIRKIDRCLRVLENVTYMNGDNQAYLLHFKESALVSSCVRMMRACRVSIPHHPLQSSPAISDTVPLSSLEGAGAALLSCVLTLLKVLLNLTHENCLGSQLVGSQYGLLDCALSCILQLPHYMPLEQKFDLLVLSLGLMINLMENCSDNREKFIVAQTLGSFDSQNNGEMVSAVEAFVDVFVDRIDAARQSEEQADALLSTPEEKKQQAQSENTEDKTQESGASSSQSSQADDLEETLMKALQKAGKNMEHSIIAAYIAILLGCVIQHSKDYADLLRSHMPDGNFDVMVEVLRKFYNFVNLTGVVGNTGVKSIHRVINILESS